jgi:hypothetical protein
MDRPGMMITLATMRMQNAIADGQRSSFETQRTILEKGKMEPERQDPSICKILSLYNLE